MAIAPEIIERLRAKFDALSPQLDERAQRLTLAAEAWSVGQGGIAAVARAWGASRSRVQQGVAELERGRGADGSGAPARRRAQAGDPDRPGIVAALLGLVEPTRRGDPESALSWTTLSLQHLAAELTGLGHAASTWTVANLLPSRGSACRPMPRRSRAVSTRIETASSATSTPGPWTIPMPDPVISVDTKKKGRG